MTNKQNTTLQNKLKRATIDLLSFCAVAGIEAPDFQTRVTVRGNGTGEEEHYELRFQRVKKQTDETPTT